MSLSFIFRIRFTVQESAGQRVSAGSSWSSQVPGLRNENDGTEPWNSSDQTHPEWDVWCNSCDSDWPCPWDSWDSWDIWWQPSNRQLDRMRRGHSRRRAGQFLNFYNRKFGVVEKTYLASTWCQVLCWQAACVWMNPGDGVKSYSHCY